MFQENKNLRDASSEIAISSNSKNTLSVSFTMSYSKTNKLITALFMVTDIMDFNEPLRHRLRTLGADILSDIYSPKDVLINRIFVTISLLDIAVSVSLISEMNHEILKREFVKFRDFIHTQNTIKSPVWIDEFINQLTEEEDTKNENILNQENNFSVKSDVLKTSKGQFSIQGPFMPERKSPEPVARIGVQKGAELLKAISDKVSSVQNKTKDFNDIKSKRQEEILKIIKDISAVSGGATISDIKSKSSGTVASCGEKTLQRELVSLVQKGVLKKSGEKRWSKYFL